VGWLEALLAPILAEDARRLKTALKAAVQFLERLTLSGVYEHADSLSGVVRILNGSLLVLTTTPNRPTLYSVVYLPSYPCGQSGDTRQWHATGPIWPETVTNRRGAF